MAKGIFPALVGALFAAGCQMAGPYQQPQIEAPLEWKSPISQAPMPELACWWEVFDEPVLDQIMQSALQNNPDLYVALQRVEEARAMAGSARSELFPQINAAPSFSNGAQLLEFETPSGAGDANFRARQKNFALPFDVNYELDMWGVYRGQYDAAKFTAESEKQAYLSALLTLTADVASSYYQLRALDAKIELLQFTSDVRKTAVEVNEARWQAGLVSYIDVSRARVLYTNALSLLYETKRLRALQENRLAVLLGVSSSVFHFDHYPLQNPPPVVPALLPSQVLKRRPDIAQAERRMAAKHALIGSAIGAFFPGITLTGTGGYSSPQLHHFLTWQSRLWELGVTLAQSIFDAGERASQLDASWCRFKESEGVYQMVVLKAFEEVENALTSLQEFALQSVSISQSVESACVTTDLSNERYRKGIVNYLEVAESERSQLEVQDKKIEILQNRYLSTIQLIKAIGGGWTTPETQDRLEHSKP